MNSNVKNNTDKKKQFLGAFGGCTFTLGQCTIYFYNEHSWTFDIVENLHSCNIDGIIGKDFLIGNTVLDLVKGKLEIKVKNVVLF